MEIAASAEAEIPKGALRQLSRTQEKLQELRLFWARSSHNELWWDDLNEVFATRGAEQTYRAVYGTTAARAGRHLVRRIVAGPRGFTSRRWYGPINISAPVPADVIINPRSWRGAIVLSAQEGAVIKFVTDRWRKSWDNEIEALGLATQTGLTHHIPKLLGAGTLADGDHWMASRLAPNTRPFVTRFDRLALPPWRAFLADQAFPVLARFYEASGLTATSVADIMQTAERRIHNLAFREQANRLFVLTERAQQSSVPDMIHARVHADLTPHHVHRDRSNWWIIDWGNSRHDALIYELFRVYMFGAPSDKLRRAGFWTWLRGGQSDVDIHPSLRRDIELCLMLHRHYMNCELDVGSLRVQLLVYLFDRLTRWLEVDETQLFESNNNANRNHRNARKALDILELLGCAQGPIISTPTVTHA